MQELTVIIALHAAAGTIGAIVGFSVAGALEWLARR